MRVSRLFLTLAAALALPCLRGAARGVDTAATSRVQGLLAKSGCPASQAGIVVADLTADSVMLALNGDQPLNPASVTKLLTAAVGLDRLGSAYTFKTGVYCDGAFNRDSGIVDGNLYIRGGGDPGLVVERLWLLVEHISHAGVRAVTRDLILDDEFFDSSGSGPGFEEDLSSRAYEAPVGALSASFNCVAVSVRPGNGPGSPVQVDLFPEVKGIGLKVTAATVGAGSPASIDVKTETANGATRISVSGSMKVDEKPRYIYRKVWQTWQNFGNALVVLFRNRGIRLNGGVRHGSVPPALVKAGPLTLFESAPLPDCVSHMFKYSSNFAAEMLFKTIAAVDSQPGTWEHGSRLAVQWWRENRLPGVPIVKNGSGMGDCNRLSASQIVALLGCVWKHKEFLPEYLSALSTAGVDGTVKSRFKDSRFKGIIRAKTGTLNNYGVCTLAGYVLLRGRTCAFAVLLNSPKVSQYAGWNLEEKILDAAIPK